MRCGSPARRTGTPASTRLRSPKRPRLPDPRGVLLPPADRELRTAGAPRLRQDTCEVLLDRADADEEPLRDLLVGEPLRGEAGDLPLPGCEAPRPPEVRLRVVPLQLIGHERREVAAEPPHDGQIARRNDSGAFDDRADVDDTLRSAVDDH